ncbi:MAG: phage integrase SAM-like domain-containing protein, partial [Planctomycetota bacterium]
MGVFQKHGTWWIDWYEGGRRRRKKTRARNKTEARKLLEQVRARIVPRELGLFDPKLKCAELITRYLEALKGTRAHHTWRRAYTALRNFFTWCPVKRVAKLMPELVERYAAFRKGQDAAIRTINIEIGAVKTCLNWGLSNNLVPSNPLARVRKLRGESQGRLRF